jgi:Na+/glutamate symporter
MKKLINKNMKKTNKKQNSKKHYEKNKLLISERNKQNRKRQQLSAKIYFYGFWLLLTAVLVDTFINQILK